MTPKLKHPPSINPRTLFSWGSDTTHQQLKTELKMCSRLMFCLSLLLCGLLGECVGIALVPKDKRGWTLNSAGYLLGPHAHQTLSDKGGLAGKREAMEDLYSLGQDSFARGLVLPSDDSILQTLMDFLSYLHLRDQVGVSHLPFSLSEETMQQQ